MDPGLNSPRLQMRRESVTLLRAHHEQMIDLSCPVSAHGENKLRNTLQTVEIAIGNLDPVFCPSIQMTELRAQNSGLQAVEPRAATFKLVVILRNPPVIGDHAYLSC